MAADPKPQRRQGRPSRRRDQLEQSAALDWHRKTTAFGCRVCPELGRECEAGSIQGHHIIRKQVIRRYIEARAWELRLDGDQVAVLTRELLWDTRNGLGVCYRAHRRHHNRIEPIPLAVLPLSAFVFASALDLTYMIEKEYA